MKKHPPRTGSSILRSLVFVLTLLSVAGTFLLAAPPAWWAERNVRNGNPPDDFAVANQGQLKNLATKAFAEFQLRLGPVPGGIGDMTPPSGVGYRLSQMIAGFDAARAHPTSATDDYTAVNLGQLKSVAQPFYDRLIELNFLTKYPWQENGSSDDFAAGNLGQLKNLFAFDLTRDSDGDGIPDVNDRNHDGLPDDWETFYFGGPNVWGAGDDPDGDGLTNLQEFAAGSNPNDFYNGTSPVITIVSGYNQVAPVNTYLPIVLEITVKNAAGAILQNAPVTFIANGGSKLSNETLSETPTATFETRTGANGNCKVTVLAPASAGPFIVSVGGKNKPVVASFNETATSNTTYPPAAPSNVVERQIDRYTYEWTWDDNADNETEYIISRQNGAGQWIELGRVGPNVTSFRYVVPH